MKEKTKYRLSITIPFIIIVLVMSWIIYMGWKESKEIDISYDALCIFAKKSFDQGDSIQFGKPFNDNKIYFRICCANCESKECSNWIQTCK